MKPSKVARLQRANDESRFRRLYENCAVAIFELDLDGNFVSANPAMITLFEYPDERSFIEANNGGGLFVDTTVRDKWFDKLQREGSVINYRKVMKTRTGRRIELQDTTSVIRDELGDAIGYQGTAVDVSTLVSVARQLFHEVGHDSLTSLSNRRGLEKELARLIERSKSDQSTHALFYLDLDRFRIVNDTFGHDVGDKLLQELAAALASRVAEKDTLARLGGDEFALLVCDRSAAEVEAIAANLIKWIRDYRFAWHEQHIDVTASIGAVLIDETAVSVSEVVGSADAACYTAKEKGRDRVHVQESNDLTVSRRLSEMRSIIELKDALKKERLRLYQQPIVPLGAAADEHIRYELLIRMIDSEGDLIAPAKFLPAAEKYNMGPSIDKWVTETYIAWLSASSDRMSNLAYGAINLSGHTFNNFDFVHDVDALLERHGIPGDRICFEITETAAVSDLKAAKHFIAALKKRGCRFALDDFGSGVSSFGYLKHLPVDAIKIDGMFVRKLRSDITDRTIVRSINDVAHSLGLITVAEFVEDAESAEILTEIGVDFAQGFGIGRPAPLIGGD